MPWQKIRNYLALENNPKIVQFAQTTKGKMLLLFLFSLAMGLYGSIWWPDREVPLLVRDYYWWPIVSIVLMAMTFFPQYRRIFLVIAALVGLTQLPWFDWKAINPLAIQDGIKNHYSLLFFHNISILIALIFTALFIAPKIFQKFGVCDIPLSLYSVLFFY